MPVPHGDDVIPSERARSPQRRLRAALAALALGLTVAAPPAVSSADAAVPIDAASMDLLRREIVDVALLPPRTTEGTPRLLTVQHILSASEVIRLTVLERTHDSWAARAEVDDPPRILGALATPWLVALDARRFALIAVAPDLAETWIRTVTWTGESIRLGPRVHVPRPIDDAGVADVDGDGRGELVLVEAATGRRGPTCEGSTIVVVDPERLDVLAERRVPNVRLAAGAFASLDEVPGDELVATARRCPAGPSSSFRLALTAVRLADGTPLLERELVAGDALTAWSGRPTIADLERDGWPEVVVGSAAGIEVLSPERGWSSEPLSELPGVLLGLRSVDAGGPPGATIAAMDGDAVRVAEVRPLRGGWSAELVRTAAMKGAAGSDWEAALVDRRNASLRQRGGAAWLDARGGASCQALVIPLAIAGCDGEVEAGPAWLATRPIARVPGPGGGGLLVARSDSWGGIPSRLTAPAPLAAEPPGAVLRHGPSGTFTLAEVAGRELSSRSPEAPVVEPLVGDPPEVSLRASAGTRVLVASSSPTDVPLPRASLAGVLAGARRNDRLELHRLDGPAGSRVELRLPLGGSGDRWDVTAAAIGPLGDVSPVVRAAVAVDDAAPALTVDTPLLSAPWPFSTTLRGSTEAGATLRGSGEAVDVAADGSFELEAQLAPWPQPVELRARDRAGNETVVRVDVVGGFDYRRLPWAAVLLGVLVAAALLGSRRSVRRQPEPDLAEPANTIEELHAGPIPPLDRRGRDS
jgi:hypothetical protein